MPREPERNQPNCGGVVDRPRKTPPGSLGARQPGWIVGTSVRKRKSGERIWRGVLRYVHADNTKTTYYCEHPHPTRAAAYECAREHMNVQIST